MCCQCKDPPWYGTNFQGFGLNGLEKHGIMNSCWCKFDLIKRMQVSGRFLMHLENLFKSFDYFLFRHTKFRLQNIYLFFQKLLVLLYPLEALQQFTLKIIPETYTCFFNNMVICCNNISSSSFLLYNCSSASSPTSPFSCFHLFLPKPSCR